MASRGGEWGWKGRGVRWRGGWGWGERAMEEETEGCGKPLEKSQGTKVGGEGRIPLNKISKAECQQSLM